MKARINTHALRCTLMDSARLGVLGTVIHPLAEEGVYAGVVLRDEAELATFEVRVDSRVEETQVDLDLAAVAGGGASRHHQDLRLNVAPKGYLVLHAPEGPGGFRVRLARTASGKGKARPFDSHALQAGDCFVVTPLRPGLYAVAGQSGKARGR